MTSNIKWSWQHIRWRSRYLCVSPPTKWTHLISTYWDRDKIAAISQTTFSNVFSWMKMFEFWLKISLKFLPKGPIDKMAALVQIMAWRRTGDKPLSEPMMVYIADAYMRHSVYELKRLHKIAWETMQTWCEKRFTNTQCQSKTARWPNTFLVFTSAQTRSGWTHSSFCYTN